MHPALKVVRYNNYNVKLKKELLLKELKEVLRKKQMKLKKD